MKQELPNREPDYIDNLNYWFKEMVMSSGTDKEPYGSALQVDQNSNELRWQTDRGFWLSCNIKATQAYHHWVFEYFVLGGNDGKKKSCSKRGRSKTAKGTRSRK